MKNKCFIDFDGTIVNNKKRLFQFFIENIDDRYKAVIDCDEFWTLKRNQINEIEWINKVFNEKFSVSEWNKAKAKKIESDYYLSFEELFDFSIEALKKLSEKYYLILVTRRENKAGLYNELDKFKIKNFFDDIIVLSHNSIKKSDAILEKYEVKQDDIFVGDTEDDIISSNILGCKGYFVLSGIRSQWLVQKLGIDVNIISNINEL